MAYMTTEAKLGAEVLGYPHPGCSGKRGCKLLKTKAGGLLSVLSQEGTGARLEIFGGTGRPRVGQRGSASLRHVFTRRRLAFAKGAKLSQMDTPESTCLGLFD